MSHKNWNKLQHALHGNGTGSVNDKKNRRRQTESKKTKGKKPPKQWRPKEKKGPAPTQKELNREQKDFDKKERKTVTKEFIAHQTEAANCPFGGHHGHNYRTDISEAQKRFNRSKRKKAKGPPPPEKQEYFECPFGKTCTEPDHLHERQSMYKYDTCLECTSSPSACKCPTVKLMVPSHQPLAAIPSICSETSGEDSKLFPEKEGQKPVVQESETVCEPGECKKNRSSTHTEVKEREVKRREEKKSPRPEETVPVAKGPPQAWRRKILAEELAQVRNQLRVRPPEVPEVPTIKPKDAFLESILRSRRALSKHVEFVYDMHPTYEVLIKQIKHDRHLEAPRAATCTQYTTFAGEQVGKWYGCLGIWEQKDLQKRAFMETPEQMRYQPDLFLDHKDIHTKSKRIFGMYRTLTKRRTRKLRNKYLPALAGYTALRQVPIAWNLFLLYMIHPKVGLMTFYNNNKLARYAFQSAKDKLSLDHRKFMDRMDCFGNVRRNTELLVAQTHVLWEKFFELSLPRKKPKEPINANNPNKDRASK